MARSNVRFERSDGYWVASGTASPSPVDIGLVEFLITAEALTHMLNPDLDTIDSELAIETYAEFEADIHRIA